MWECMWVQVPGKARGIGYHWNCAEIFKLHLRVCMFSAKRQLFRSQFSSFTGSWGWLPRIEFWWAGWAASAFTHLSHLPAQPMRIFNRLEFKDQNQYRITTLGGWWLLTSLGRGPGFGFQNEPVWQFTTTCNSSFSRPSALFWPIWASMCTWGTCIHSDSHMHIKRNDIQFPLPFF